MSVPSSSFQPCMAGSSFWLLSVKRTTRSISHQHPSQTLKTDQSANPRTALCCLVKDLSFSSIGSGCPPAELNVCHLTGYDEISCLGCIVLNLGHLNESNCEECEMLTCFLQQFPEPGGH
ncbi:hypothetical protein ATANTOWER_009747 [Ataeniobius toweri]|uniref:Uncharacterized protein n=1 Tax=Ataeniobius toweri TaxID=208326 RepID=A0ABU7AFD6_9TELE|nr:hypothetical protein [Ataeniobius toweri]